MGTSVRLSAQEERLVARVAKRRGETKSDVIRSAIVSLAKEDHPHPVRPTPYDAMKHLIGCVSGGPPDLSTRTGERFREALLRRRSS